MADLDVRRDGKIQYRLRCANVSAETGSQCHNKASGGKCARCGLVAYCSKNCQAAHWPAHKIDCNSPLRKSSWRPMWEKEVRMPTFLSSSSAYTTFGRHKKFLWGNTPAIDILNLAANEGESYKKDLSLLFAASGDWRNLLMTVASIPRTYKACLTCVINDRDDDVTARNIIFLLIALVFDLDEASIMILHFWYSAFIPKIMAQRVKNKILPLIQDVCVKISNTPNNSLQSKRFIMGSKTLRVVLTREQWMLLPVRLTVPVGLTAAKAKDIRNDIVLAPLRVDYRDRHLFTCSPSQRVAMMRYRTSGVLAPFGASLADFDTPNPTLFYAADTAGWLMKDNADPTNGWLARDFADKALPADNDLYGGLYIHILDILRDFGHLMKSEVHIGFEVYQADARALQGLLVNNENAIHFDRIELSNVVDGGWLGVDTTCSTFGPALRMRSDNPHAALIGVFLNAVNEVDTDSDKKENLMRNIHNMQKLCPMPMDIILGRQGSDQTVRAEIVARSGAADILRDYDGLFARYAAESRIHEVVAGHGLKMRLRNKIAEQWPRRLKLGPDGLPSQEDFDALLSSYSDGSERYAEFCRAD